VWCTEWCNSQTLGREVQKSSLTKTTHVQTPAMSSIYTARAIVGNDKPTPLFTLKGLQDQVPDKISNLNIQAIPLENQLAYTQYSANISCFIYATYSGQTVVVSSAPLGRFVPRDRLPFAPPPLSFALQKPLSPDQSDRFLGVLGAQASTTQSGKTTIYHAPQLPVDKLPSILKISTPFLNAGRDAVNPKGLYASLLLSGIASLFLKVHTYPAFRTEDKESRIEFGNLTGGPYGGERFTTYTKTLIDGVECYPVKEALPEVSHSLNEFRKRRRDEDMDTGNPHLPKVMKSDGFVAFSGTETVTKANPTKAKINNIGSPSDIPEIPGLLFPYFPGLIQPDPVSINSIILRRFYPLLGSTHEECQSAYSDIRHGVNSLSSTSQGMELAHIFLGIDLALESQSRCFLMTDSTGYRGFALLGARFAIFSGAKWYAPEESGKLLVAARRMDPHRAAVEDIVEKLAKIKVDGKYSGMVNEKMFDEPETLADELALLKVDEIEKDIVRELDRLVRSLNYMGSGYLTQNPQMISEMLTTLSCSTPMVLERPTHFPSITAPFKDRIFQALSKFGPEAPSFWNDRGSEIMCRPTVNLTAADGGKRKIGAEDDFGNMPAKIMITPKPLLAAVSDMKRVIEKGKVKMDVNERAGRYRCITLEDETTRKRIWNGLLTVCAEGTKKAKVDSNKGMSADQEIDVDEIMAKLLG